MTGKLKMTKSVVYNDRLLFQWGLHLTVGLWGDVCEMAGVSVLRWWCANWSMNQHMWSADLWRVTAGAQPVSQVNCLRCRFGGTAWFEEDGDDECGSVKSAGSAILRPCGEAAEVNFREWKINWERLFKQTNQKLARMWRTDWWQREWAQGWPGVPIDKKMGQSVITNVINTVTLYTGMPLC